MNAGRTRIKICGVRDARMARAAAEAGADAVGFVLVPGSKRFIRTEDAARIMHALPPFVSAVTVVANLSVDQFCELEAECPAHFAQLHGAESVETVRACGPDVIKGLRFDEGTIDDELARWGEVDEVAAVLVDGSAGGEGASFDWTLLASRLRGYAKPVFLAGGLTPENVGEAIRTVRPYAVDVSSGVERAPGEKDHDLIRAFCAAVREADAG